MAVGEVLTCGWGGGVDMWPGRGVDMWPGEVLACGWGEVLACCFGEARACFLLIILPNKSSLSAVRSLFT